MRCKSSIVSCAPAGPMTQTTFSASLARSYPRGASPEAVSFPVAAIQLSARIALLRRAKARWFRERGFPGSAFPVQSRGFQARQGVTRWQSALGGRAWSIANPLPIRIVQMNYCVLSSAAGSCRSACRAARLASFSAACSCRNFVSCRWYSALNSCVFRTFLFCGHLNPCNSSAYIVLPVIFSSRRRSARNRRPLP